MIYFARIARLLLSVAAVILGLGECDGKPVCCVLSVLMYWERCCNSFYWDALQLVFNVVKLSCLLVTPLAVPNTSPVLVHIVPVSGGAQCN